MSSLVHSFTLAQRLEPAEVWQLIISQVPVQDLLVSLYELILIRHHVEWYPNAGRSSLTP